MRTDFGWWKIVGGFPGRSFGSCVRSFVNWIVFFYSIGRN